MTVPQHKSCKKQMQLSADAHKVNQAVRSSIRDSLKVVRTAKSKEEAMAEMPKIFSKLDKAAKNSRAGFNANRVANYKSKVSKVIKKLEAAK